MWGKNCNKEVNWKKYATELEVKIAEMQRNFDYDKKILTANQDIKQRENDMKVDEIKRTLDLTVREEINKLKDSMKQALIDSDIKRVEAVAKLETYMTMNTKDEHIKMIAMLQDCIKGLSQKSTVQIVK